MSYSLCMMADFQNGLSSRIFSVFSSFFFHRITVNDLQNGFRDMFWNFNFSRKVSILHGLRPLHDSRFSKWSHFSNI